VVIVDGDLRVGESRMARIQEWVAGEYILASESGPSKFQVSAAAGLACWQPSDTPAKILQRADAAMYEHKARMKAVRK
jgi:PleD family two-component response regulator